MNTFNRLFLLIVLAFLVISLNTYSQLQFVKGCDNNEKYGEIV
jgi:hypothetical protein